LGKKEEDDHYAACVTSKRKALETEKEETEEQKLQRQEKVAKEESKQQEVSTMNRPFYCELCNKQYTNVSQYDTHLSSYDHHHKKRLKEMKQFNKNVQRDLGKKKERQSRKKKRAPPPVEPPVPPQPPPPPSNSAPEVSAVPVQVSTQQSLTPFSTTNPSEVVPTPQMSPVSFGFTSQAASKTSGRAPLKFSFGKKST